MPRKGGSAAVTQYYREHPEKRRKKNDRYRENYRGKVINAYGGKCVCCGETEPHFLSIDHIDGGGRAHRREIGNHLYQWLIKNNFPKDNFQLLCYNCNCAKGHFGECPHETARKGMHEQTSNSHR